MSTLRSVIDRLRDLLRSRSLAWCLAALAMLLCTPSLRLGWLLDDDFHRAALTRPDLPTVARSPAELFVFIEGNAAANRMARSVGMLPWWSHEQLRLAFFRPLTGLTHWLDYRFWRALPWLMHFHSLIWLGGVVVAATWLYRRMLGATWVAGLAALLFAVDDAHGLPAVWLANRNVLIGTFFGLLTLIAHDRWRRDGWWPGAVLAPLALVLGLLSKESTLAIWAYLAAYVLFLDRGKWPGRLCSLAPCTLVGVLWWMAYKHHGYGVLASGWYVDPGADPVQFARAVVTRAPNLLAWQWLVPSDLRWNISPTAAHAMWLAVLGFLALLVVGLVVLLRRNSRARFWALGMVLSVLPACAAYPADRLLFFVGIGAMGLLAQLVAAIWQTADGAAAGRGRHLPVRALCIGLMFIHLGMAPLGLARAAGHFEDSARALAQAAASLPTDPAARFQTVVIVNTPTFATFSYSALTRLLGGEPYLSVTHVLGSGSQPIEIHRPDERTLVVRPEGGFLAPAGDSPHSSEMERLLFDQRRALLSLDRLYRDDVSMAIGQRVALAGVTAEVTAVTDDGRPAEAAFHFMMELENPFFRWMQWEGGEYVAFDLPAVGETVVLPPASLPPWAGEASRR